MIVISITKQFLRCHLHQHQIKEPWNIIGADLNLYKYL